MWKRARPRATVPYRKYPEEITRLTERIEGYEQDVALVADHPKAQEGFCGMEVDGKHYTEKEDAGKAIIDVCTRMTGSDAVLLGQYRGFSMVLAYDGRSNEYRITLKGTLSHTVTLGADVFGNITRLDNALENLAGSLQAEQNSLEETKTQLENARTELAAPFAREEELAEKTARLKELNILLNMDEKDKTLMDDTPDEGEDVPARRVAELARYANLDEYAKTRSNPYNISYEEVCAEVMGPKQKEQLRRMIGFRFKRHESLGLPEEHLQAIEKHLEGRVRKLLAIPTRHLKQEKAR